MKNILVNGAAGFLGSHTVEYLSAAGFRIRATDRPGSDWSAIESMSVEVSEADLLDASSIGPLLEGMEAVVNIAGLFDYSLPPDVLDKANVRLTENMCHAALKAGIKRFVHISSIAVYGLPRQCPMDEDHPQAPTNAYERSKLKGEKILWEYYKKGLPATCLRPAGIYGPRSRYGQVKFIALLALLRGLGRSSLPVISGGPKMHHVHARDVARGIQTLLQARLEQVSGKAFNVADDRPISQGELINITMQCLGMKPSLQIPYYTGLYWPFIRLMLFAPSSWFDKMAAGMAGKWQEIVNRFDLEPALTPSLDKDFLGYMRADYALDTTRLKLLGYRPRYPDPQVGLKETIRWYEDARWLPRFG